MDLRDIAVTLIVFGSLPFIFARPYIGVLVWSWLSYMNPHRMGWSFAYDMPFAQIVAIVLLVAVLFSSQKKSIPPRAIIFIWFSFLLWMVVSTVFAFYPESAFEQLIKIAKIQLITILTVMVIDNWKKLNALIWVIVLSIGFFSVKGGLFTIMTGGGYRVYGPPSSFIEENNGLALATLMVIPLMVYLYQLHKGNKMVQRALLIMIGLSTISAVGSQSRGAFLAMAAVGGFFWLKTRTKIVSGIALVIVAIGIFSFMPQSWHERMGTLKTYEEDGSAMGRLNAWQYSINLANDRLTGGGLQSWSRHTFALYAPDPGHVLVAHSIYFHVLADHGWPGLILFGLILWLTWTTLRRLIRATKGDDNHYAENLLARMIQVSLIAYFSGGAFLSLSYFDLPWHLIAIAIILESKIVEFEDGRTRAVAGERSKMVSGAGRAQV